MLSTQNQTRNGSFVGEFDKDKSLIRFKVSHVQAKELVLAENFMTYLNIQTPELDKFPNFVKAIAVSKVTANDLKNLGKPKSTENNTTATQAPSQAQAPVHFMMTGTQFRTCQALLDKPLFVDKYMGQIFPRVPSFLLVNAAKFCETIDDFAWITILFDPTKTPEIVGNPSLDWYRTLKPHNDASCNVQFSNVCTKTLTFSPKKEKEDIVLQFDLTPSLFDKSQTQVCTIDPKHVKKIHQVVFHNEHLEKSQVVYLKNAQLQVYDPEFKSLQTVLSYDSGFPMCSFDRLAAGYSNVSTPFPLWTMTLAPWTSAATISAGAASTASTSSEFIKNVVTSSGDLYLRQHQELRLKITMESTLDSNVKVKSGKHVQNMEAWVVFS